MALVYGQLESLKKIRDTLDRKGISRFNSIGQLNNFIKNYENEKEELFYKIEQQFEVELDTLKAELFFQQKNYDELKTNTGIKLNEWVSKLDRKCTILRQVPAKNALIELGNWYLLQLLIGIKFTLKISYILYLWIQTFKSKNKLKKALKKLNVYNHDKHSIISARFTEEFKNLEYTKAIVNKINPLIAGAIGEHLVAKELEKLPDNFVLINDFSFSLNPPIFNKKNNDRIYSIQIDHLLITNAGIFILETKNWSKESIGRLDLRSPIEQIQRTNYALFILLNSYESVGSEILKQHHWGKRELPIKNVIAMINNKPKGKFKHVAIKKLSELNRYISYFEPIFNDSEIKKISALLRRLNS